MIGTIVRNGFLRLRRDRGALILTFVLPVAFFTIFAFVFGQMRSSGTQAMKVVVVDQDRTAASRQLVDALKREASLAVRTAPAPEKDAPRNAAPLADYTAATAEAAVRQGDVPAAIIIPKGYGASPMSFGPVKNRPTFTILHDSSDPIAAQLAAGMLQKSVMTGMPDVMAEAGSKFLEQAAGGFTPEQRGRIDADLARYREYLAQRDKPGAKKPSGNGQEQSFVALSIRDVVGEKKRNPMISFYAAGIGVMFLLFTANGAAGSLIDESETGALDRLLSARVNMTMLLTGKLAYCTLLAVLQLVLMFLWGAAFFQLDLFTHLPGFFVMTAVTAFACASFGLVLASLARTRAQLAAISTLLILTMSALGGSMFPRFLMPEVMQKIGLFTFNAWAIDGYTKVFWRDLPVTDLLPQVEVLVGAGIVLFLLARLFARRWETA